MATYQVKRGAAISLALPTPWDLTGWTIASEIRVGNSAGQLLGTFTIATATNPATGLLGTVNLYLPASVTNTFKAGQPFIGFDIKLTPPDGKTIIVPDDQTFIHLDIIDRVTV